MELPTILEDEEYFDPSETSSQKNNPNGIEDPKAPIQNQTKDGFFEKNPWTIVFIIVGCLALLVIIASTFFTKNNPQNTP